MTTYLSAIPAYGRDYTSKKAVLADWEAGLDFYVVPQIPAPRGGYVNKDGLPEGTVLNIRYRRLTQICVIDGK
jgi:hypothetical protein